MNPDKISMSPAATKTGTGKVAFFLPSLRGGGAERVMLTLANAMARRGVPVDLVLCQAEGEYLADVLPGIPVVDLRASRVLGSLPALSRYIRRERPEVIIAAMNHANVVAFLAAQVARLPVKIIMTEHNTLSKSTSLRGTKGAVLKGLMRATYARCHRVIAVSDGVAADLVSQLGLPMDRVRTIYNPVVSEELIERSKNVPPEVAEMDRPVLLAVGRLTEQKDYPTMLRAFARLPMRDSATLVILGVGPLDAALGDLASELGIASRVRFLGFRDNPYAWMRATDLFVMSSAWEGLPTVLIEAMACGAPVVSTDCPSGPDEILEGGKWGKLVPVGDFEALADAMETSLAKRDGPDVRLRSNAFTVNAAVEAYLSLTGITSTGPGIVGAPLPKAD